MMTPNRYWTIVRLTSSGSTRRDILPPAHSFWISQFPPDEAIGDAQVQRHLVQQWRSTLPDGNAAELCLRCYTTHQIEQICLRICRQFGAYYGFAPIDLLILVLDDDGKPIATYTPLTRKILHSFQPDQGSLATWTAHLVRQNHELNAFLLDRGLHCLSEWAILNDTKPQQLPRIFTEFCYLTNPELEQAIALLESYHAVYLPDRLQQRRKGRCLDPTNEQLARIGDRLQQTTGKAYSTHAIAAQLVSLANHLRRYRIARRRGLPTQALKDEVAQTIPADDPDDDRAQAQFFRHYQQQFLLALDQAIETVVRDRLRQLPPEKGDLLVKALHRFYCDRCSMTQIATQLGLRGQDSVTRLLRLKALRSNVRRQMLLHLQPYLVAQAKVYGDPDRLEQLDSAIETVLNEQIEALLTQEAKEARTRKDQDTPSLFAQRVCAWICSNPVKR